MWIYTCIHTHMCIFTSSTHRFDSVFQLFEANLKRVVGHTHVL
jgi:hypothetical protein